MRAQGRTGVVAALSVAVLLAACAAAGQATTPAAEPTGTPPPSPVASPSTMPTAEPTPSAAATTGATPEPASAVEITALPWDVRVGDEVSLAVRAPAGMPCSPTVRYRPPTGGVSPTDEELRLPVKTADAAGTATWVWTVEPVRPAVMADVELLCGDHGTGGSAYVTFLIYEGASATPIPTLPPEFAGTWIMEPDPAQGYPGERWAIAFVITGDCALGHECGSFYLQGSACRYPLVLSGVRPGWVNLDVREAAPEEGCGPSRFGSGQTLEPIGDGTLAWGTRDGWSARLHRFEGRLDG